MRGGEGPDWEPARRVRALQERLRGLSITEASGDGTVKVTVSANGVLTDLVLRERWRPTPLPEVAAEIMECMHRAQARIPDLLRQAMADTLGETEPASRLLLADARQRFPEPAPAEQAEPREQRPAHQPRPDGPDDTDDWDEREVLEKLW